MLTALNRLWREYPDLRLGQMMMNLAHSGFNRDLFNIEDDDMATRIDEAREKWSFMKEDHEEETS